MAQTLRPNSTTFTDQFGVFADKAFLVRERNPNDRLIFHLNPGTWEDDKSVDWAESDVPGTNSPILQFAQGRARRVTLTILLNEFGNARPVQLSCEDAIAWLMDSCTAQQPLQTAANAHAAPPTLVFFWGQVRFGRSAPGLRVVLTDVKVTRQMYKPGTLEALRAEVEISLMRTELSAI